jgi:hypothetical protein
VWNAKVGQSMVESGFSATKKTPKMNYLGRSIIFIGCELICFTILIIAHEKLLTDDLINIDYYKNNFSSAYLIYIFTPLLIGVCLILLALFWNRINRFKLVPIITLLAIMVISLVSLKNEMDSNIFDHFIRSYSAYLIFLFILWIVIFILHWLIMRKICPLVRF